MMWNAVERRRTVVSGLLDGERGRETDMARLPENNTARCLVDYATGGPTPVEHTILLRYTGGDRTAVPQQDRLLALLNAIGPLQLKTGWRVLRVRTALAGEAFTVPQAIAPGLAAFVGTQTNTSVRKFEAIQYSWVARAVGSRRRSFVSLFGFWTDLAGPTFRWTVGQSGAPAWVAASVNALNGASSPLVAIDGSPVSWYPYVNTQYNSYWERRLRVS